MRFFTAFIAVIMFSFSTSCTKEEDKGPEQGDVTSFNQVKFFQNNIVQIDSLGNIVQRVNGTQLDPVNDTELYIGVENIEEAIEIFKSWFSPDTEIKAAVPSTADMKVELKDLNGKTQETVYFKAVDKTPTLAEVSFEKGSVIKYVSKLIFIKESAWPNNAQSPYYVGDFETHDTYEDGKQKWVCIKKAEPGQNGLMMYISSRSVSYGTKYITEFASPSLAKQASSILRKNWNSYVTYFQKAGRTLDGSYYWINDTHFPGIYAIRLSDGDIDWFDIVFRDPYKHYIQIRTFGIVE